MLFWHQPDSRRAVSYTHLKEAALKAAEIAPEAEELEPFFKEIFEHAEYTLSRTPEMLPVLKEAGVVDSGGQGLLEVLRGAIDGFLGKEVDYSEFEKPAGAAVTKISPQAEADIKFGYCTEFIILLNKPMPIEEEHSFKEFLTSIGDSIVLVAVSYTHLDVYKRQLVLYPECPAFLELSCHDIHVTSSTGEVQFAREHPMSEDRIRKQMDKLGNTEFEWDELDIQMGEQIFLPVKTCLLYTSSNQTGCLWKRR